MAEDDRPDETTMVEDSRLVEAESLLREDLDNPGPIHPKTIKAQANLINLGFGAGRTEETEPLYREVVDGLSRSLGSERPDIGTVFHDLGVLPSRAVTTDSSRKWTGPAVFLQPAQARGRPVFVEAKMCAFAHAKDPLDDYSARYP